MDQGNLSRRGFLQRSLAVMGATGLPAWYAQEVLAEEDEKPAREHKRIAANDHVLMGAIGIGSPESRGLAIMGKARSHPGVRYVAACDVDRRHLDRAARLIGGRCAKYHDFRELLDRRDINAVTIAVPDHWHTLIAIEALKKGKDVYCEKPLTLTVAEGLALVKVARKSQRVFQTGTQQRSDANFRLACELVRNGRLGTIRTVETRIGRNPTGTFKPEPIPKELDWDLWLGQTPLAQYTTHRCHYDFRWWYEYSGGKMTDWGAHHNDVAQWGLGMDDSGPVAVEATGQPPSKLPLSYNTHLRFVVKYRYANGARLVCSSDGENGIKFIGDNGQWIFVSRGGIRASDRKLLEEPLPRNAVRLYQSNNHMGNFLECLRTRKPTICPAEVGFHSVTVCHIGVIALRTGKHLKWDPAKFRFDDDEANRWLSRPMRKPWKLEV